MLCERDERGGGCVVCALCKRDEGEVGCVFYARKANGTLCVFCARDGGVREIFWKMVYEKFGCKPFSVFLHWVFRSAKIIFSLTSILQQNKHLQILKIFSGKYFTTKQTKPKVGKHFLFGF